MEVAGKEGTYVYYAPGHLFLHCCRAFAVVETIASAYAIQSNHLYQLSPQQLISCDYYPTLSLDGCQGGSLKEAFQTTEDVSPASVF